MLKQGTKVGSAYIEVTAPTDKFRKGMADMEAQAKRSTAATQAAIRKTDAETKKLTTSMHSLHGALAAIGGTYALHKLIDTADAFSLMRSRIRLVTQAGEDMLKIEEQLTQQAMINRSDLKSTIDLYTRLRQSRKDLSDETTQNLVDKWSKSLIISASSAQEAASSTMQFSQAMAAGVLAGQELRSVIQGNSAFAVYLAEGLGIATGELKQMGEEGKLTIDVILAALEKSGSTIEHDFAKKALTVHQALTNVETATIRLVGVTDQTFGISGGIATWVNALAGALGDLTLAMQGPIKQAEDALTKMRAANAAVAADVPHLTELQDKLAEAIASQGAAAEDTARIELNAVTLRIAKNKELAAQYQAIARAKLAEAEAELQRRKALLDGERFIAGPQAGMTRRQTDEIEYERIKQLQAQNKPLAPFQLQVLERRAALASLEADVAGLRQAISDLDKGIGLVPEAVGGAAAQSLGGASPAAVARTVSELSGYYTALENYERSLTDIRKASAEGAVGANRAIVQAMMEYLDAGGSIRRVLEDVAALSGNMLDPESVKLIERFVDAMRVAETIDVPSVLDRFGNAPGSGTPTPTPSGDDRPWQYYEQRVAEATKAGLMQAVETGDWGDAFAQILTDVTREALSNAIDMLWQALAAIDWNGDVAGGNGLGAFFSAAGDTIGGMFKSRASGGPVGAGDLVRVGELGSEWFVPKTDGFIIPHGGLQALSAPTAVTVGGPVVNIYGNADSVTRAEIASTLDTFARNLPAAIDARVTDRRKRGAY